MTVYSEEVVPIPVGLGLNTYKHPANLEEGFVTAAENVIARGDSLISRKGFSPPGTVDTRETLGGLVQVHYSRLPASNNENWPVAIWGGPAYLYAIRNFNRDDPSNTDTTEEGIGKFTGPGNFIAACTYLDRFYMLTSTTGVDYYTNWNWNVNTVDKTNVIGSPLSNCDGLFIFKDRMWAWDDTKIYYTNSPSSPGAYPEDWAAGGNFLVIGAGGGAGKILNIVPANNKLFVFTTSGLYTISVAGSPTNWIVRTLDHKIQVNDKYCAYEHKGLVYFIDINGVHVTNGLDVKDLSEPIADVFEDSSNNPDEYTIYKMHPFEEGFLISTQNIAIDGTFPSAVNRGVTTGRVFYTRTDFIAWTEFTFDNTNTDLGFIAASWPDMETHDTWTGNSYIVMAHGESTDPIYQDLTTQLLRYTGYQDTLRKVGEAAQTVAVSGIFTSRVVRGEMFQIKRAKYAYINVSAETTLPDAFNLTYKWDTEEILNIANGTVTSDIQAVPESLIKIPAQFHWRHILSTVGFTLDAGVSKYEFLGVGIIIHTNRRESRESS